MVPERLSVGFTVASTLLKNPLKFAAQRGIDEARLLAEVGLRPDDLGDAQTRIARTTYHQIFDVAAELCGEPDFGLLCGDVVDVDTFHVVGHILAGESTVLGVLRRLSGLHRLLDDSSSSTVEMRGDRVVFITREPSLETARPRQAAEFAVTSLVSFIRIGTLGQVRPCHIGFIHPSPGKLQTHERVLGVTPKFGGSQIETVFDNADIPLTEYETPKVLQKHLVEYAESVVAGFDEADMISSLERVVLARLPRGTPQIEQIARNLGVSKRTLQRRLEEEGLTFRGLVDRVRRTTALKLLSQDGASMGDVSSRVGYSDVRSLRRALGRWDADEAGNE